MLRCKDRDRWLGISLLVVAVAAAACSDSAPTSTVEQQPQFTLGNVPAQPSPNLRQADLEYFEVCKDYSGTVGPDVTIDVSVVSHTGTNVSPFSITLSDGECEDVWLHGGEGLDQVTVTENPVPDGYAVSYTLSAVGTANSAGSGTNGATGAINGTNGVLVEFTNTFVGGGEGCTPGYWKQEQHFDSWTSPLAPTADFTAPGFTSPGSDARVRRGRSVVDVQTQLQALMANQGSWAALTRHAMAALLNAASPSVDYDLSEAQVIAKYNGALAGSFDVNDIKNELASYNEQGCPIN